MVKKGEIRDWSIYRITSPNGKVYIGVTCNMDKRMSVYRGMFNILKKQTLIYQSIRKYGFQAHELKVIDKFTSDVSHANSKEMFWIRTYMSNRSKYPEQKGLNLKDGGGGAIGFKPTSEMNERNRQNKLGKRASEETKKKMRKSRVGKKMPCLHYTIEFRKALSERGKKYRHTEEAKKKISEASKGNKHAVGYKMTPEQIEHRSSLLRGKKKSPENLKKHLQMVVDKFAKPIVQFDLKGNLVKEYNMLTLAKKELKDKISSASIDRILAGKKTSINGFVFKYKEDSGGMYANIKRNVFNLTA